LLEDSNRWQLRASVPLDVPIGSLNLTLDGGVIADRRDGHFPRATSVANGRHSHADQCCCFGLLLGLLAVMARQSFNVGIE
uniref:CIA30 domain-containing protein n=1 Tax=Gongylonema pulchrum TaxID=637853 RepID=A0A183EUE8_9BILA